MILVSDFALDAGEESRTFGEGMVLSRLSKRKNLRAPDERIGREDEGPSMDAACNAQDGGQESDIMNC